MIYQMKKPSPIIVSGSIAIDRIMGFGGSYADHISPDNLKSLSVSVFLDSLIDSQGGVGANIAFSLALLGEEPVLLGSAGRDALLYLEKLAHAGVNIAHVYESDLPTASFSVITDGDQNQIGGFYPGAMFDSDSLSLEPWKDYDPIVVVSPHDPKAMRRQVEQCAKWDLRLVYDIGQQVTNLGAEEIAEGLAAAKLLILNEYEIAATAAKVGQSIDDIKRQVPIVITTFGKDGSVIEGHSVKEPIKIGVAVPTKVLDPTGAGDAYRAGFLYGWNRDWSLKESAQLGATCASCAIEQHGTQNHSFDVGKVSDRYLLAFGEKLPELITK